MKENLQTDNKVDLKAEIVDLINKNYGSQAELARVMGITEANLSNKLGRLSKKFLSQLESYGVYLNKSNINSNNVQSNDRLIKVLERLVKSQDETIISQRATIQMQQQSLMEKNQLIEKLRQQIEDLVKEGFNGKCL